MRGATSSSRDSARVDQPGGHRPGRRRRHHAEPAELVVQRAVLEVGVEHGAVLDHHGGVLEGDRHAVGEAHPLDADDLGAVRQAEVVDLLGPGRVDARRHEPRRRRHAAPRHLLGERQEHAGPAVHRPRGDERPLAALTVDEAGDWRAPAPPDEPSSG